MRSFTQAAVPTPTNLCGISDSISAALFLETDCIIHSNGDLLLGTEIAFGGLDGRVPEEELDLLEIAAGLPAELMGWSAASALIGSGDIRGARRRFPCKYTRSALISARRSFTWLA